MLIRSKKAKDSRHGPLSNFEDYTLTSLFLVEMLNFSSKYSEYLYSITLLLQYYCEEIKFFKSFIIIDHIQL